MEHDSLYNAIMDTIHINSPDNSQNHDDNTMDQSGDDECLVVFESATSEHVMSEATVKAEPTTTPNTQQVTKMEVPATAQPFCQQLIAHMTQANEAAVELDKVSRKLDTAMIEKDKAKAELSELQDKYMELEEVLMADRGHMERLRLEKVEVESESKIREDYWKGEKGRLNRLITQEERRNEQHVNEFAAQTDELFLERQINRGLDSLRERRNMDVANMQVRLNRHQDPVRTVEKLNKEVDGLKVSNHKLEVKVSEVERINGNMRASMANRRQEHDASLKAAKDDAEKLAKLLTEKMADPHPSDQQEMKVRLERAYEAVQEQLIAKNQAMAKASASEDATACISGHDVQADRAFMLCGHVKFCSTCVEYQQHIAEPGNGRHMKNAKRYINCPVCMMPHAMSDIKRVIF